jgi:hypothetical protein
MGWTEGVDADPLYSFLPSGASMAAPLQDLQRCCLHVIQPVGCCECGAGSWCFALVSSLRWGLLLRQQMQRRGGLQVIGALQPAPPCESRQQGNNTSSGWQMSKTVQFKAKCTCLLK